MTLPNHVANPDPDIYKSDNYVVLDFETSNIEHGTALNPDNRLVMAAWRNANGSMAYRYGGELDMAPLVAACEAADFIIAHNAKFELQWLERCGYDIGSRPVYCTMVAEWVLAGNRRYALNLAACADRHELAQGKDDTVSALIKAGVCPSDIPRSLLQRYGLQDVRTTHQLFLSQMESFDGTRLLPVVYTRCLVIPALADIESRGLHLDSERVEEVYAKKLAEWTDVMASLDAITGGINPNSPPQVASFLYGELGFDELLGRDGLPIRNKPTKQFPEGMPKTDEATLMALKVTTPEQERFMELKKRQGALSAALDKNLSMFVGACREQDGMIYAEVNQGRTVTHRTSSAGRRTYYKMFDGVKGCQFQNLPRVFKKLFSPRYPGWLIGETDGSQLEFRVAGHLGDDDVIKQEVCDAYDVHSFTQKVISESGGKSITRNAAKRHTFKPLYGGTSGTKAEKAYYSAFAEKYHKLVARQEDWCIEVGATKKLETPWGFIFHWPHATMQSRTQWVDGKRRRTKYLNVRTNVVNAPIQSFATADIIPIALAYFWYRSRDAAMFIVNTVHDSIEVEFPPQERELYEELSVKCFTEDVYNYLKLVYNISFSIPLGVGMCVGEHWGEPLDGEEEKSVQVSPPQ